MLLLRQILWRVKARLSRINPDRLWLFHVAVLAFVLALFVAMHAINRQIIASSSAAHSAEDIAFLRKLQWADLLIAGLVLLVQAAMIFLPTHLGLQRQMQALRNQATSLLDAKQELEHLNKQLSHLSNHDALTGLPNRRHLVSLMSDQVAQRKLTGQCLLFIGLDGFKSINDSAGHELGDHVLVAVSRALSACVDEGQIVARINGDEFAMLTDEPPADIVQRVKSSLSGGISVLGRDMKVTASIGYLVLDNDQSDPLAILADAAMAMQVAKTDGGNRARHFTPALRENAGQLQRLQLDLPAAIRNGELEPWFQPQVRLTDGALHGVEVLARWRHPTRGLLTPDRFLPVAERAGMMIEMDHAIWSSAMTYAKGWQRSQIWHPLISLNAAPDTIADPHLIERFLLGLRRSGLAADQVIIEVLETTLIAGADDMTAINIDTLAECGIALELDDFGTGYASLCRLTQLPLSGIKLDRSLVAPLPDHGADSVVRAILALAAELGLHVIAEGIEEKGQAQHLSDRGCIIGQGYGFARPMPPNEFEIWLRRHANRPVTMGGAPLPLVKQA